jgi:AraC-like DNA-binding protein
VGRVADFREEVRFVRPAHSPGLELVHYSNMTRGRQGIPEACTSFATIPWLEGDVDFVSRGRCVRCEPGWLTSCEPGDPFAIRPRTAIRGELRVVRIDNDLLDLNLEELGVPRTARPLPLRPQLAPALMMAFSALYRAIEHGERLEMQGCTFGFLAALVEPTRRLAGGRERNSKGVGRARDLLHARFEGSPSLDELASAAGIEKFALLRAFARELGLTPHAYLVQLRVARARRLIAHGGSLADVALAVGYSEQSALTRQFRRLVGVTPGVYARAAR